MRRRDVALAILVGLVLWIASWPYRIDYATWLDSAIVWIASAAFGLVAVVLTLILYLRAQRAVTRDAAQRPDEAGRA